MAVAFVRRQFLFLITPALGAAMIVLFQPLAPGYAAIADSCSVASAGSSCINVTHSGRKVQRVQAKRYIANENNICNYTATLSVTTPGVPYPSNYKPKNPPPGQCSVGVAWIGFPSFTERTVVSGTTFCTRWYENDVQQGKTTCVTIK